MRSKILIILTVLASIASNYTAHAGIFSSLAKTLGFNDEHVVGQIAQTADQIGNAVVANNVNASMNKYGSEQITSYNEWAAQYNENQDRKIQQYLSEVDQFKMDYAKSHGFYDQWYAQYGENWFERIGRNWFDNQDDLAERKTGNRILPWHLRDTSDAIQRPSSNKVDGSLTNVVLGALNLSDADASRADEWKGSDRYGKRDILIDQAFNIIETTTDNKDMVNAFRRLTKANNHYLKDKANTETSNIAISNMALDLSNIIYDAYERGAENKKAYLANKLQIRSKLEDKGINPAYANEIAGTVLSILNNKDLSQHEKNEWLRLLGFFGEESHVLEVAQSVSQISESQAKDLLASESANEEQEEKLTLELEEKMRQERELNEAISTINAMVVDSYSIDNTDLNDRQKEVLFSLVEILKKYDNIEIEIIGNTCDLGATAINDRIGLNRAEKVREYLIEAGIDDSQLSVSTDGENSPAFENTSTQNRLKNRRVIFIAK